MHFLHKLRLEHTLAYQLVVRFMYLYADTVAARIPDGSECRSAPRHWVQRQVSGVRLVLPHSLYQL